MDSTVGSVLFLLLLITFSISESQQKKSMLRAFLTGREQVLDNGKSVNFDALAKLVCSKNDSIEQQISKSSTIIGLQNYFANSELNNDDLNACANTYKDSLAELAEIVSVSNENVCSEKKVSLIRDYHQKYISRSDFDKIERKNSGVVPKILQLFFINYTFWISARCKLSLVGSLDKQSHLLGSKIVTELSEPLLDNVLNEVSKYVNPVGSVEDFDDILLGWDGVLLDGPADIIAKQPVRLYLVVKDANKMIAWQSKCRNTFKPVYGKVIMPVVRLADCGYSATTPLTEYERAKLSRPSVKLWYSVAQTCEAILPIKFLSDGSLLDDDVVRLGRDDGRSLAKSSSNIGDDDDAATANLSAKQRVTFEPKRNSITLDDELPIESDYSQRMLADLNLDESIVDNALTRAMDIRSRNNEATRDPLYDMF